MNGAPSPSATRAMLEQRSMAAIKRGADPIEADCLRAERAGAAGAAWASSTQAQRGDRTSCKRAAAPQPNPTLRAWLCLAEGLRRLLQRPSSRGARDAIERAYALAAAARRVAPAAGAQRRPGWRTWTSCSDELPRDGRACCARRFRTAAARPPCGARARQPGRRLRPITTAAALDRAQPWYEASRAMPSPRATRRTLSALMHNRGLDARAARRAWRRIVRARRRRWPSPSTCGMR